MKILSLGLDSSILDINSRLAARASAYGALVDRYAVVVPHDTDKEIKLSDKVTAYGVAGGSKALKLFRIFALSRKLFKKNNFDIISVQDQYFLALVAWLLARRQHAGLEVQFHGLEHDAGVRKYLGRFILRRADAVRTVSQRMKTVLVGRAGVDAEKITVAPIYNEIKSYDHRTGDKSPDDKFIFLTIGRLVPVKNISLQIEAMAEIVKKYPRAELWIAGEGREETGLKVKSEKLKVVDKTKFLGWQQNLDAIYQQADAFLLTSDHEGWGLVVIEAAAHGLPVIMTDVGCAGEVIINNDSGLVIPVGDGRALVEAMGRIMESHELRLKLAKNAQIAISNLPSREETYKLYKQSWEKARKI